MRKLLTSLLAAVPNGRRRLVLAILLASLASLSSVALMGVSAWLISFAALAPPVLFLQAPAVGVRAFAISRGVFRYLERVVGHDVALRMQGALRIRVYDKLAGTTLIGRRRGDLLTRVVADVTAIQDLVVRVVLPFASAAVVVVATTGAISLLNLPTALWLFATALLAGIGLPLVAMRLSRAADVAVVPVRGRLADETRELAHTATDLVAYGADRAALDALLQVDDELRRAEARSAWVRGLATGGQILAAGIAVAAALWFGTVAVVAVDLDPRFLAVLALTPLALHEVFAAFTQAAQTWTRSRSALGRITEILDADPVGEGDVTDGEGETPELSFKDVTVGWPDTGEVLSHLDLRVSPGERVALVGPSGIGKTTVAATALGLIPPLSGSVHRTGRVGYLEQDAHIFATTVGENVRVGLRDATDEQIQDALHRAGLDLDPSRSIGEDGTTLSGGERRRLALSRLLVGRRDLIILDEPTEHLDRETADALMADVWTAFRDAAVLVITHDPEIIRVCDRFVSLARDTTPV